MSGCGDCCDSFIKICLRLAQELSQKRNVNDVGDKNSVSLDNSWLPSQFVANSGQDFLPGDRLGTGHVDGLRGHWAALRSRYCVPLAISHGERTRPSRLAQNCRYRSLFRLSRAKLNGEIALTPFSLQSHHSLLVRQTHASALDGHLDRFNRSSWLRCPTNKILPCVGALCQPSLFTANIEGESGSAAFPLYPHRYPNFSLTTYRATESRNAGHRPHIP